MGHPSGDRHGRPTDAQTGRLGGRLSLGFSPIAELAVVVPPPTAHRAVVQDCAVVAVSSGYRYGRPTGAQTGRLGGRLSLGFSPITKEAVPVVAPAAH